MAATLSLWTILVWFVWGFFMALGWTLGAWLMSKVLH